MSQDVREDVVESGSRYHSRVYWAVLDDLYRELDTRGIERPVVPRKIPRRGRVRNTDPPQCFETLMATELSGNGLLKRAIAMCLLILEPCRTSRMLDADFQERCRTRGWPPAKTFDSEMRKELSTLRDKFGQPYVVNGRVIVRMKCLQATRPANEDRDEDEQQVWSQTWFLSREQETEFAATDEGLRLIGEWQQRQVTHPLDVSDITNRVRARLQRVVSRALEDDELLAAAGSVTACEHCQGSGVIFTTADAEVVDDDSNVADDVGGNEWHIGDPGLPPYL